MRQIKSEFFYKMSRKPFYRFLRHWFKNSREYNDVHVAKCLSSMLTHCFIELEKEGNYNYVVLDVSFQIDSLSKFIRGEISASTLRQLYKEKFYKYVK